MRLDHVALTVSDRERSATFYATWFGLNRRVHEDDHLLILADAGMSLLAMTEGPVPAPGLPSTNHFGFRADDPEEVRERRAAFTAAGVAEAEWQDDGMVRVQVFDPDGYRVDLYAYG